MTTAPTPEPLAAPEGLKWGPQGLLPGVVQDVGDGAVLMVGYLDAEAVAATLATGLVHFHSRSRGRLWRKGETSGNVLRLREIRADCDGDALLLRVEPAGPTCHTGARSCFDAPTTSQADRPAPQGFAWLEELWATIAARAAARPTGSYTARLLDGGVDAVARKVSEEATEVLMAAKDDAVATANPTEPGVSPTRSALAGEMADLLYHLLVLAAERDLPPAEVLAVLRARHRP